MVSTAAMLDEASDTTLFGSARADGGQLATSELLCRSQVIERIMTLNPTASVSFLEDFTDRALRMYLDHLGAAQVPRGRRARWVRSADMPGIVMAERRD